VAEPAAHARTKRRAQIAVDLDIAIEEGVEQAHVAEREAFELGRARSKPHRKARRSGSVPICRAVGKSDLEHVRRRGAECFESLLICSATDQIIWFRLAFCLVWPLTLSQIAPSFRCPTVCAGWSGPSGAE